jgi:Domain of unknown function (DUF6647)
MNALLTVIVTWLSLNYGLPAIYEAPAIRFASPTEIVILHQEAFTPESRRRVLADEAALAVNRPRQVVSVYDSRRDTIVLPLGWKGVTPAEQSMLVHEMVHHLQSAGGLHYACPGAREKLAYDAQEGWLDLFGQSLESEFRIDRMTLLVSTGCGM